ncbi:hypothetical protein ABZ589_36830 [Streptomyces sp. NPDC013313]|uniref:hypothetical protein n=1 Tax=Streptomyces sp. NPDC013313 TaxID=3155603 RepID=UPI0033BFEF57
MSEHTERGDEDVPHEKNVAPENVSHETSSDGTSSHETSSHETFSDETSSGENPSPEDPSDVNASPEDLSDEPHEAPARREPAQEHGQEHLKSHAGNRTVNHGPDEKGSQAPGTGLDGLGGPGSDELLRSLLHSAVDGLEPRTGTLDHLRRAVPARRARKRQAAVGMAAAALFIGTAVPALVHVSNAGGTDPNTAMAGQSSEAQGGASQGKDPQAGTGGTGGSHSSTPERDKDKGKTGEQGGTGGGNGSSGGTGSSAPSASGAALCTAVQLGSVTGGADGPDSTGVVYGTFRVTNTSGTACTVTGGVVVSAVAQGAADPAKVSAVRHVAGDAAAALPDPSLEVAKLVLQPGGAYEERFAFVPSETCPAAGGGGTPTTGGTDGGVPSPDPTPSQSASVGGGTETGGTSGTTTQLLTEEGTADGSVVVGYTGETGSPSASATVPDACAGTVYYTGVLAAS